MKKPRCKQQGFSFLRFIRLTSQHAGTYVTELAHIPDKLESLLARGEIMTSPGVCLLANQSFCVFSVDLTVACSTERNQVFFAIRALMAAELDMVDLKGIRAAAVLATPAVAPQHLSAQPLLGCEIPCAPRIPDHAVLGICSMNCFWACAGRN